MNTATENPTAPTREELHKAWEALADGWEEGGSSLVLRLARLVNADEIPPVTMEEIGALLVFANDTRGLLAGIERDLRVIEEVALEDLSEIERDGGLGHKPTIDAIGIVDRS